MTGLAGGPSVANAVSADGSVIVGTNHGYANGYAFRWTEAGGAQGFGVLPGGISSGGHAVGPDGLIAAGYSAGPKGSNIRAILSSPGLLQNLGTLPGGTASYARGMSHDGSVVVGYGNDASNSTRALRWTAPTGMMSLGTIPGGTSSYAYAVSGDGQVIVGWGAVPGSARAFRWSSTSGMVELGPLPQGFQASIAWCVGQGGAAICGSMNSTTTETAFLWTADLGVVSLNEYLPTRGINLAGWTLHRAWGISPDGQSIVGEGTHQGAVEAWIVSFGPVCYANCDGSWRAPLLNVHDFACFLNRFAAGETYANCDGSTTEPVLTLADFACFLNAFASGCR